MLLASVKKLMNSGKIVEARSKIISQLDQDRFLSPMKVYEVYTLFPVEIYLADNAEFDFLSSEDWSKEYWSKLRLHLNLNFSKEKLEHILNVMLFLREKGDSSFLACKSKSSVNSSTPSRKEKLEDTEKNIKAGSAVAGALVGGGVIGAVCKTGLGAIVGACAGGLLAFVASTLVLNNRSENKH